MIFNLLDADRFAAWIVVNVDSGSTVTATLGSCVLTATASNGQAMFRVPRAGSWAIKGTLGGNSATATVSITERRQKKSVTLNYFKSTISVTYPAGSTCTATCGSTTLTAPDTSGTATFTVRFAGNWVITSSGGGLSASQTVSITASGQSKSVTLQYFTSTIAVTWPSGSTCTATCGSTTLTAPNTSGSYTFTVHTAGSWVVSCSGGGNSASATVSITANGQSKSVSLTYNKIPAFTYTGQYKIVDDSGNEITSTTTNNWNIRLLTSGTLTFTDLRGTTSIDIFMVGGGGGSSSRTESGDYGTIHTGGAGGGYTKTQKGVAVSANAGIAVSIGAGGTGGWSPTAGGTTSVTVSGSTYSARGGNTGNKGYYDTVSHAGSGGSGGSGGGGGSIGGWAGGTGGSNGGNGSSGKASPQVAGSGAAGQGTTTRAFGESSGELFAYGGSGGGGSVPVVGTLAANTGHGGQGSGGSGYSGIAIVRGHR